MVQVCSSASYIVLYCDPTWGQGVSAKTNGAVCSRPAKRNERSRGIVWQGRTFVTGNNKKIREIFEKFHLRCGNQTKGLREFICKCALFAEIFRLKKCILKSFLSLLLVCTVVKLYFNSAVEVGRVLG